MGNTQKTSRINEINYCNIQNRKLHGTSLSNAGMAPICYFPTPCMPRTTEELFIIFTGYCKLTTLVDDGRGKSTLLD